eukprot:CAMPEP_0114134006 /NCGR_PEP_ID=MMETSP0043_2-20121206/13927_1 /TAXON_ID=464988 /ORGANISM="Hemiselmis andersenii, Strain CCMP644" /LENGTH=96 /DNA_ID=CAMNT_0001227617 /DNA_START=305 /DNA_END=592 /DNA_ORIENTATION=+
MGAVAMHQSTLNTRTRSAAEPYRRVAAAGGRLVVVRPLLGLSWRRGRRPHDPLRGCGRLDARQHAGGARQRVEGGGSALTPAPRARRGNTREGPAG